MVTLREMQKLQKTGKYANMTVAQMKKHLAKSSPRKKKTKSPSFRGAVSRARLSGLKSMTVAAIKKQLKAEGYRGYSGMKKAQLIALAKSKPDGGKQKKSPRKKKSPRAPSKSPRYDKLRALRRAATSESALADMPVAELKKHLTSVGHRGHSRMKKAQLLKLAAGPVARKSPRKSPRKAKPSSPSSPRASRKGPSMSDLKSLARKHGIRMSHKGKAHTKRVLHRHLKAAGVSVDHLPHTKTEKKANKAKKTKKRASSSSNRAKSAAHQEVKMGRFSKKAYPGCKPSKSRSGRPSPDYPASQCPVGLKSHVLNAAGEASTWKVTVNRKTGIRRWVKV